MPTFWAHLLLFGAFLATGFALGLYLTYSILNAENYKRRL